MLLRWPFHPNWPKVLVRLLYRSGEVTRQCLKRQNGQRLRTRTTRCPVYQSLGSQTQTEEPIWQADPKCTKPDPLTQSASFPQRKLSRGRWVFPTHDARICIPKQTPNLTTPYPSQKLNSRCSHRDIQNHCKPLKDWHTAVGEQMKGLVQTQKSWWDVTQHHQGG